MVRREGAGQERRMSRQCQRRDRCGLREPQPTRGECVQGWSSSRGVAITAQPVGAKRVDGDEKRVRTPSVGGKPAGASTCPERGGHADHQRESHEESGPPHRVILSPCPSEFALADADAYKCARRQLVATSATLPEPPAGNTRDRAELFRGSATRRSSLGHLDCWLASASPSARSPPSSAFTRCSATGSLREARSSSGAFPSSSAVSCLSRSSSASLRWSIR